MKHSEAFLTLVDEAKTRIRQETATETLQRLDEEPGARLVDVREDNEWQTEHVATAVHLGRGVIERDIERVFPDKTTELHLYCGGGFRSALVADNLQKMGYNNVISVDGGFKSLKEAGAEINIGQQ